MADPASDATATVDTGTPQDPPDAGNGDGLTTDQRKAVDTAEHPDQVRDIISAASRRARQAEAEAKAVRQELQGHLDQGKSELEKAASRAERAEARVVELERSLHVTGAAARHGIPAEHVHRLVGSTEEELDADAKALAKALRSATETPPPDLGSGPRDAATAPGSKGFSDSIRRQAQRRR